MATQTPPYGVKAADGSTISDPKVCAVTGKPVERGDVRQSVYGTRLFYWLKGGIADRVTDEQRADMEAAMRADAGISPVGESVVEEESPILGEEDEGLG